MKIALIIDPRSVNGSTTLSFTLGHISGLKKYYNVDFVTPYDCDVSDKEINQFKLCYKHAQNIKNGKLKRLVKGIEYCKMYSAVRKMVKKTAYDFVEIEWTVLLSMDIKNIKYIKKYSKVVVRAHNILPHSTGKKYYNKYKKIYELADLIIVHGQNIKKQMCEMFTGLDESKIAVQLFGVHGVTDVSYDESKIPDEVIKKVESSKKIFLCVGRIDNDKGFDRVVKIWLENNVANENLLIVAGKCSGKTGIENYEKDIEKSSNILFLNGYVDDNLLNYLFTSSDIVVLPYRNGSMSGVAFTAAQFSKTVIATDFGAMSEYLPEDCGWLCANDDLSLTNAVLSIIDNVPIEQLAEKGQKFANYINDTATWQSRVDQLYKNYLANLK